MSTHNQPIHHGPECKDCGGHHAPLEVERKKEINRILAIIKANRLSMEAYGAAPTEHEFMYIVVAQVLAHASTQIARALPQLLTQEEYKNLPPDVMRLLHTISAAYLEEVQETVDGIVRHSRKGFN